MSKTLFKTLTVIASGVGAVTICFLGFRESNQRQYRQRVEYAQTEIINTKEEILEVEKAANTLFTDETHTFLEPAVNEEALTTLTSTIYSIKTSAKEYGIEETDLPKEALAIQAQKKTIEELMNEAQAKVSIQEATAALFVDGVSDWQTSKNNVVLKEGVTEKEIGTIRESLGLFEDSSWKKAIHTHLGYADEQLKQLKELKKLSDSMIKEGKVTSSVTYEDYLVFLDGIANIRNEKEKETFSAFAEQIAKQKGYETNDYGEIYNDPMMDVGMY